MIRLVNAVDYWISPTFTWSTGGFNLTLNHNKGKYIKGGAVYYPDSGSYPRFMHLVGPRDASGIGNDYGVQLQGGIGLHTLNSVQLHMFNPYPDVTQTDCIVYLEFLDAALPN